MNPVIAISRASRTYRLGARQVPALREVSLEVQRGELVALCGPSGSGKSTLLNVCGLIDAIDGGSYRLDGRDVARMDATALTLARRLQIGFVFQSFNLVPVMTAYENVEYPLLLEDMGARDRERAVSAILERVGLADCRRHRPDELSGGQRQRVAVARALVKKPVLVVADEPTANLDTETASVIIELLRDLGHERGTTALVATHDTRMTRHCDRVVNLVDGRVL